MSAFIVFTRERLRDKAEFAIYSGMARSTRSGHPSEVQVAYGKCETLEGAPIEGAFIIKFESMAAAKAWYESPAYREARQHRFKSADYRAFITESI